MTGKPESDEVQEPIVYPPERLGRAMRRNIIGEKSLFDWAFMIVAVGGAWVSALTLARIDNRFDRIDGRFQHLEETKASVDDIRDWTYTFTDGNKTVPNLYVPPFRPRKDK